MEWKQTKPSFFERADGYSVAARDDGLWQAARPNGFILRDKADRVRKFGSPEGAQDFCDHYHRNPKQ